MDFPKNLTLNKNLFLDKLKLVKSHGEYKVRASYIFWDRTSRKHREDAIYFPIDLSELEETA